MNKVITGVMIAATAAVLVGCSKSGSETETKTETSSTAVPPRILAVVGSPVASVENMSIAGLKPALAPGDAVTLQGKVMGSTHPFVEGRAAVVIGDESTLESCDISGDGCTTPWDVCCASAEAIQAGTLLIQVVDANGELLKHGLKGVKGLQELTRVRVKGVVAPSTGGGAVTINAEAIEIL